MTMEETYERLVAPVCCLETYCNTLALDPSPIVEVAQTVLRGLLNDLDAECHLAKPATEAVSTTKTQSGSDSFRDWQFKRYIETDLESALKRHRVHLRDDIPIDFVVESIWDANVTEPYTAEQWVTDTYHNYRKEYFEYE